MRVVTVHSAAIEAALQTADQSGCVSAKLVLPPSA
jgi:hypothetical protein